MEYSDYTNTELFLLLIGHFLCKELKLRQYVIVVMSAFINDTSIKQPIETAKVK